MKGRKELKNKPGKEPFDLRRESKSAIEEGGFRL